MPILYTEYNNGKFKISAVVKKKIVCFIGVSNFSSRKFIENCNWNLVALVDGKVQNSVTLYTFTFTMYISIHERKSLRSKNIFMFKFVHFCDESIQSFLIYSITLFKPIHPRKFVRHMYVRCKFC